MVVILLLTSSAALAQSTKTVGVEFQVNTYTPGRQAAAVVDRETDGDFVVVWESSYQDGSELRHVRPALRQLWRSLRRVELLVNIT